MKLPAPIPRIVVVVLAATLSGALPGALAAGDAALSGRVVVAATHAPLEGARVHVADPRNGEIHSSGTTFADGSFAVRGLERATYLLSVESNGGLYVVNAPLALEGERNRAIEIAVEPQTTPTPGSAPGSGKATPKKKLSVWENPLTATLIVLGGAIVVGAIVGSSNNASTPASVSGP